MSDLHYNTISEDQKQLLQELSSLDFGNLVGGTGLSLQIGHRKSFDLDYVVQTKLTELQLFKIKKELSRHTLSQRLLSDTQYTAFADAVKVTFFQDVAEFLHPIVTLDSTRLVSPKDIFSTKLFVMGKRATWRDYVDVAVCLDQNIQTLEQGIKEAVQRYQVAERWILDPLTYFDDLEMTPIDWIGTSYSDDEIKSILKRSVEHYIKNI